MPPQIRACLFDLDGVLTRTATVHARAWKDTFDAFLRARTDGSGKAFEPFDVDRDYASFVDGRPRLDGTRSFLNSRGITLTEGTPDDAPGTATVEGISNQKNALVLRWLAEDGVEVFEGSVRYVRAVRAAGLATAVVSASANAVEALAAAAIADLFDARIDGVVARDRNLSGKPAPDTFLAGAAALGVAPAEAAVFEDALAGVQAGTAGGFGFIVGVDRSGRAGELRERGADVVVGDLAELLEES